MRAKNLATVLFAIFIAATATAATFEVIEDPAFSKITPSTDKDFSFVEKAGEEFFIQNNLIESDYILGHDKLFYGSSQGVARVKLYVASKFVDKEMFIGVETKTKDVSIDSFGKKGDAVKSKSNKDGKIFVTPTTYEIQDELAIFDFNIVYDPKVIGFEEKMDFILYDSGMNEIARADPYLSGFDRRYPINFNSVHSEILIGGTETINGISTTGWTCTDTNSIAVGWNNLTTVTELDLNITGTCPNGTVNIQFKDKFAIPANTAFTSTDTNGYYIYTMAASRASPLRNLRNVYWEYDSWEDGQYTTNPTWTQGGGAVTVQTTTVAQGSYAPFFNSVNDNARLDRDQNAGIGSGIYEYWVRATDVDEGAGSYENSLQLATTGNTANAVAIAINQSLFKSMNCTGNCALETAAVVDTWYKLKVMYIDDGTTFDVNLYSVNNVLLEEELDLGTFGGGSEIVGFTRLAFENKTGYMDGLKVTRNVQTQPILSLGTLEIDNSNPDVNITYPNVTGLKFNRHATPTIDINFSIIDLDDNSLLLDLNYSTSSTQGTGTVILNDTNTLNAVLNCTPSVLNLGATCRYVWDISSIPDGNYFMLATLTDGIATDFDASDANFNIFAPVPPAIQENHCDLKIETTFYIGEYLQIALTGTDINGHLITDANYDVYLGADKMINQQPLSNNNNLLTHTISKKINDAPYTVVVNANGCKETKIVERLKNKAATQNTTQ